MSSSSPPIEALSSLAGSQAPSAARPRGGSRPHIVLLGDFHLAEFEPIGRLLQLAGHAVEMSGPDQALRHIAEHADVELIVVFQHRPGQWNGEWLDQLRRRSPLTRTVVVLGTWCEGETRTGRPLPADVRIDWHQFAPWWECQMQQRRTGRATQWSYLNDGKSASPVGCGTAISTDSANLRACAGLAILAATDRCSAEALALACGVGGWSSVWVRPAGPPAVVHGASALVYDGGQLDAGDLSALSHLRATYGPVPVVAITDLPTIDGVAAARACGATWVLGKPYSLDSFLWALQRCLFDAGVTNPQAETSP